MSVPSLKNGKVSHLPLAKAGGRAQIEQDGFCGLCELAHIPGTLNTPKGVGSV